MLYGYEVQISFIYARIKTIQAVDIAVHKCTKKPEPSHAAVTAMLGMQKSCEPYFLKTIGWVECDVICTSMTSRALTGGGIIDTGQWKVNKHSWFCFSLFLA